MTKNNMELTEALNQSAGNTQTENAAETPQPATQKSQARQEKKLIGGHFDKAVHYQLKLMALERECSVQHLLAEALDYLFTHEGKPTIARILEK